MTPEERAKEVVDYINMVFNQNMMSESVALIAQTIREAEQAMSKYWEMTVGQERDELKKKVAELEDECNHLAGRLRWEREME